MNKLFIFSCIAFLISSCTSKYKVEGTTSTGLQAGSTIYLKSYNNDKWSVVDSARIVHGSFHMSGNINKNLPKVVTLFIDNIPLTPVILEKGDIIIDLSSTYLTIKGTPLNDKLHSFYEKNLSFEQEMKSTSSVNFDVQDNSIITDKHQQLIREFIINNSNNVLSPTALTIYKKQYPQLMECEDIARIFNQKSDKANSTLDDYQTESTQEVITDYPTDFFLW